MKMKTLVLTGTFAAALLFGACKKDNKDNTNTPGVSAQDTTYISGTSKSNRSEVATSTLALTRAADSAVLMFAQKMIDDHNMAQTKLSGLADSIGASANLNSPLDPDQVAMVTMLSALSGHAFDSAYISGQVTGHQKTLSIFDTEITGGQNAQVKNFATLNRPMIQMHYDMATAIRTSLQ